MYVWVYYEFKQKNSWLQEPHTHTHIYIYIYKLIFLFKIQYKYTCITYFHQIIQYKKILIDKKIKIITKYETY